MLFATLDVFCFRSCRTNRTEVSGIRIVPPVGTVKGQRLYAARILTM